LIIQAAVIHQVTMSPSYEAFNEPVSILVYRSRSITSLSEAELEALLHKAQERNRSQGLTGLLIYDQGTFFQWLEGPAAALAQVWESIKHDPRHRDVHVLRNQTIPKRFFSGWDMRLALHSNSRNDSGFEIVGPRRDARLDSRAPPMLAGGVWDEIFADVVVPKLKATHLRAPRSVALLWHADADAPVILAGKSLGLDPGAMSLYLDGLVAQGASLETLFGEVFEPAIRHLGGLWYDDQTTDAAVTVGLGRLQIEARRLSCELPHPLHALKPDHAVLIAAQPGEPHAVNSAMASELFWRDGWDVSFESPSNDAMLTDMVHDHWFDVLDLSLSGAYRREDQLQAMSVSVRAAQAASLNPALAVIVNGRAFVERPSNYFAVGADAACVTVVESVGIAQRLLDSLPTQQRIEQALMDQPRNVARRLSPTSRSLVAESRAPRRLLRRR
jgi:hypothetical protein